MKKDYGIPEYLEEYIIEKLYIFMIVYVLYIDVRADIRPTKRSDLKLPMNIEERVICVDKWEWWRDHGIHLIVKVFQIQGEDH